MTATTGQREHDEINIPIVRAIPLWQVWVILGTGVITVGGLLINQFYGQQRLIEKVQEMTTQIQLLTISSNERNINDAKVQLNMADMQRRLIILEEWRAREQQATNLRRN